MPASRSVGEDVDRTGAVVEAGDAAAGAMGEADARALDLARPAPAAQLADDLDDLRGPGGADRVAPGQQPARRVHRDAPAERGLAVFEQARGLGREYGRLVASGALADGGVAAS